MHVLISGGTGFIGQTIVKKLIEKGHFLTVLTRHQSQVNRSHQQLTYVKWLGSNDKPWEKINNVDVIINLSGDPLNRGRWTPMKKERILSSRIDSTQQIANIVEHLDHSPQLIINASAVGIYGYSSTGIYDETAPTTDQNFPAKVCSQWEKAAMAFQSSDIRTVIARFGIVLGADGGALSQMMTPYRFFIGGPIGSGQQWVSWIHIQDVVGLIEHIIFNKQIQGVVNFTAPQPIKMGHLGEAISKVTHRPHWLPVPSILLKLIFGEMSEMLTKGQHVIPQKAMVSGYSFKFSTIEEALEDLLTQKLSSPSAG